VLPGTSHHSRRAATCRDVRGIRRRIRRDIRQAPYTPVAVRPRQAHQVDRSVARERDRPIRGPHRRDRPDNQRPFGPHGTWLTDGHDDDVEQFASVRWPRRSPGRTHRRVSAARDGTTQRHCERYGLSGIPDHRRCRRLPLDALIVPHRQNDRVEHQRSRRDGTTPRGVGVVPERRQRGPLGRQRGGVRLRHDGCRR
jgi:hypothetical protein